MGLDPLRRFSSRAQDYAKYRPSYPPGIIDVLHRDCGLTPRSVVADVGSGTGLLSRLFLDFGCEVLGIEPNAEMRRNGEEYLAGSPRFRSIDGQAERTGLPSGSVDVIVAGQAFHWFDAEPTRVEFARILRAPRWVALIWNERRVSGDPFLERYEDLLRRFAPDYGRVDHRRIDDRALTEFFGHSEWNTVTFDNQQRFDLAGVRGRLLSSSYAPVEGAAGHEEMMRELDCLFSATERDGRVVFAYTTRLHYGKLT